MSADIEVWPPPNDATAFESLCLDLWLDIWQDCGAQKNGRNGQPQAGVDVFGQDQGRWVGVQCKQKDGLLRKKVTFQELTGEVEAARQFKPLLARFILATTGPRDEKVQQRGRELTERHRQQGLFTVEVWSWEEIWRELHQREKLLKRIAPTYWPRLAAIKRGERTHPEQTREGQKSGLYKNILIEVALIAVGSGFFTTFNDYLEFLGVHGAKPWCILSGLVCVEFAVAHWLFKSLTQYRRVVTWIFASIIALETISVGCVVLFGKETQENELRKNEHRSGEVHEAVTKVIPSQLSEVNNGIVNLREMFGTFTSATHSAASPMNISSADFRNEIKRAIAESNAAQNADKNVITAFDVSYPGFLWMGFLRIGPPKGHGDSFIFDMGENLGTNRLSIYLDEDRDLAFRVMDSLANTYAVRAKRGLDTFSFNQMLFVTCELGSSNDVSFLRLSINGKVVGEKVHHFPILMTSKLMDSTLGSDLNITNYGVFQISQFGMGFNTLAKRDAGNMMEYMNKFADTGPGGLVFSGEQSMRATIPWVRKP